MEQHKHGIQYMVQHGKQKNTKRKEITMSKKEENKSFEELMANLESIVQELEKGELNLDDSVAKFEEGMKISKECNKILEDSEKRISILLENNGEISEEDFEA